MCIRDSSSVPSDGQQTADQGNRGASGRPGGRGGRGGRGGYVPSVKMAIAEDAAISKTIEVLGEARALKSVELTSEVTGLVGDVNIAPGQRITQGDTLLQIEDEEQSIALASARAQYPIAKANADRYRTLVEEEAASPLEAEQAFNALKTLEAQLRSAEFAIDQRTVRAPFGGIVGITTIEPGDYIRAGDVITTVDDTSSIVVEFSVPQESAAYVTINQPVAVRLTSDAGRAYNGSVSAIDSRIDAATRTLRVEATVDNNEGRLLPGSVFAVSTTKKGENAIAVPGLAVQWNRSGAFVWKRNAEGKAARASVVILQRTDDVVLVEGDIKPGDAIVADGADRVREGVPLPEEKARNESPANSRATKSAVR